jgi:hypothetical protein
MVCPRGWSLPHGVNLAHGGELGPQGWTLIPRGNVHPLVHTPGVNSLLFRKMEGKKFTKIIFYKISCIASENLARYKNIFVHICVYVNRPYTYDYLSGSATEKS